MSLSNITNGPNNNDIWCNTLTATSLNISGGGALVQSHIQLTDATNQITLGAVGGIHNTIISAANVAGATQTLIPPDSGSNTATFILSDSILGSQKINSAINLNDNAGTFINFEHANTNHWQILSENTNADLSIKDVVNNNNNVLYFQAGTNPGIGINTNSVGDDLTVFGTGKIGVGVQLRNYCTDSGATAPFTFYASNPVNWHVPQGAATIDLSTYDIGIPACNFKLGVDACFMAPTDALLNLSTADSGKIIHYQGNSTPLISVIPNPFLGARYEFIIDAENTGNAYTLESSDSNIYGFSLANVATVATLTTITSKSTINFDTAGGLVIGDKIILIGTATNWIIETRSSGNGFTFF